MAETSRDVNVFDQIHIGLATADAIRTWSNGEVRKPETINYRTLKPEKDGLFCEKIFGPTKDWECYCGKYKRVRFKGIICERCGVEVTRSKVRRDRMGHIELAAPAVHIWYLRGTRSWLAYLLSGIEPKEELKAKQLEKVIYFAANLVTWVDEDKRHDDLESLEADMLAERDAIDKERELELARRSEELEAELEAAEGEGSKESELKSIRKAADKDLEAIREGVRRRAGPAQAHLGRVRQAVSPPDHRGRVAVARVVRPLRGVLRRRHGCGCDQGPDRPNRPRRRGAQAPRGNRSPRGSQAAVCSAQAEGDQAPQDRRRVQPAQRVRPSRERSSRHDPRRGPGDPPDLRPMVQLDGGRFATSDLNDLYRRVINRNNRLKRLLDLGAPEIIVNNEKRMLQEAVDALFDNGRRGRPVTGPGNRPLKSLSDMLKGKQGRFRQNLLGKRVDYSGRSVIVVGPTLHLHQCGLPKLMALELFKPFVMKALVEKSLAQNIKSAKRMVERRRPQVWDVLEDVIKEHPVLLNRAPTLHRLGIQAFEPILVEGKAVQIHPLVCTAFNADFDGDQMAVHLPLSAEAQAEARVLMLSSNNMLSPAHGRPLVTPTQDMIIGAFYISSEVEGAKGEGMTFRRIDQIERAVESGALDVHAKITYRGTDYPELLKTPANGSAAEYHQTTAGRILLNECLPDGYPFVNRPVRKREMTDLVDHLAVEFPKAVAAASLDALKSLCFNWAMRSGLTVSIDDVRTPANKYEILDRHEAEADKVEKQFRRGVITDGERKQKEVEIWTTATSEVTQAMSDEMSSSNSTRST
ncbi:MAG: hypothetical protein M5U19_03820 [Microthrixaceae bacterium]|nr:hypothetical protein [Microthrixaceae bacterium]